MTHIILTVVAFLFGAGIIAAAIFGSGYSWDIDNKRKSRTLLWHIGVQAVIVAAFAVLVSAAIYWIIAEVGGNGSYHCINGARYVTTVTGYDNKGNAETDWFCTGGVQ